MKNKILTREQQNIIRALRAKGMTYANISERLGVSVNQISHMFNAASKRHLDARKQEKWTPDIVREWRQLSRERWTYKRIAEKYGTRAAVVGRKLMEGDI